MKKLLANISPKQFVLTSVVCGSFLVFIIITVVSQQLRGALDDQRAAQRWSQDGEFSQVSCFFAETVPIDQDQIYSFRDQIETGLREASYVAANENARAFIDAYCSQGTIVLENGDNRLEAQAIGTGGDFFLFHPLRLLSGAYFSGNDLMRDFVILDEVAAWQLFGSNDIAGMQVMIQSVPHIVAGVISHPEGRMWENAGLTPGTVYVSCETLAAYGETAGIKQYEAVMPNPVSGFAYRLVKERFGFDERQMQVIDNTDRYSLQPLLTVIADFGVRSMQQNALSYPYWENHARGFEDILALMLLFRALFLAVPVVIIVIVLFLAYRRRTWTWKQVFQFIADAIVYVILKIKERKRAKAKSPSFEKSETKGEFYEYSYDEQDTREEHGSHEEHDTHEEHEKNQKK